MSKQALIRFKVRPTLLKFERNIPFASSFEAIRHHQREGELLKFALEEVLQALALDHSIIVAVPPNVTEDNDIAAAQRKTTIRAAFILAEGQAPGIVKADHVQLGQEFEYDQLMDVSDDTVRAIITPEGTK